jgi:hypothetical protein
MSGYVMTLADPDKDHEYADSSDSDAAEDALMMRGDVKAREGGGNAGRGWGKKKKGKKGKQPEEAFVFAAGGMDMDKPLSERIAEQVCECVCEYVCALSVCIYMLVSECMCVCTNR